MSLRPFDILGLAAVLAWLAILGAFSFVVFSGKAAHFNFSGEVDLREETLYLSVFRSGEEVGILREDRTRLLDGWLIEIQGVVELDLLGESFAVRLDTKTSLSADLSLRSTIGVVEAFGWTLRVDGRYRHDEIEGHRFEMSFTLEDAHRSIFVPLQERPYLIGQAIPRMLASGELRRGMRVEHAFFDPMTMRPSRAEITYDGEEEINHYGQVYEAHRFRQTQAGMESTIYVEADGSMISQFLPFEVFMARIPEFRGNQHLRQANADFGKRKDKFPALLSSFDPERILGLLALSAGGTDLELFGDPALLEALDGVEPSEENEPWQ